MSLSKTQLQNQIPKLQTELTYSKVEHYLSVYYERQLEKEVSQLFRKMQNQILNNLNEYYDSDVMFKAHMDLILAPIHELHREYYEILIKYKIREFDKSRAAGKRIVERMINFRRKGNIIKTQYTVLKADFDSAVSSIISKEKLFGTSPIAHENLRNRTYQLSERTLARVDSQINDIITNGYNEGQGINSVAHDVTDRFNQLKTWEAKRIARTEIHNSQTLGVLQGYEDLGVEYLQWSAAHDERVRDIHRELDGEIVPMGALFSNGLMYPGDMNGPASEVINCRCQALPFIIPYGYIAPPFSPFRESDLIATLEYFNADDLVSRAMDEVTQMPSDNEILERVLSKYNIDQNDLFVEELTELITLEDQQRVGYAQIEYFENLLKAHPNNTEYPEILSEIRMQLQDVEEVLSRRNDKILIVEDIKFVRDSLVRHKKTGRLLGKNEVAQILEERGLYSFNEMKSLKRYKSDTYEKINDMLWDNSKHQWRKTVVKNLDKFIKETEREIEMLDAAIAKSPGLTQNTRLFRYGRFDGNMKVGDVGILKGFTSTSYVEDGIHGYKAPGKKFIEILAPKGQKGVAMNGVSKFYNEEHEFLLPRNQKYKVIEITEDLVRIMLI